MAEHHKSQGKYYLNGTCVQYAVPPISRVHEQEVREYTKRSFKIGFKQRMKLYDAITLQHFQAASDPNLYHTFLTATFEAGNVPDNPNNVFSDYLDRMRKAGFINYAWTRELTKKGTPHYHFTIVGPKRPINAKKGWSINKCWSDARGYYSGNGIRSSINPISGRSQMIINSLWHARRYVAKYISKANEDQSSIPGRIYAVSNDLQNCPPIPEPHAIHLANHPLYGTKNDFHRGDWSTIAEVKPEWSKHLYDQLAQSYRDRAAEAEKKRKKRQIQVNISVQTQIFQ